MEELEPENLPRPCDWFDMIGGTSTGGLIAIMLGRLRMIVQQGIDAYLEIMPLVFIKQKHRMTLGGQLQGRYNSQALEDAVKKLLGSRKLASEEYLKDAGSNCKVFFCATSRAGLSTAVFSNYASRRRSRQMFDTVRIWEAARATSAATTFFDPIQINN